MDLDSSQCNFSFFLSLRPSSNETQNANPSTKTQGQGQWHPLCQAELSACPWFALTVCTYHIIYVTHGWPKIPDRNTLKLGGLIWLVASESWVVHHGEESRTGHVTAGAHDRILHLAFHTGSRHNTGQSQRWLPSKGLHLLTYFCPKSHISRVPQILKQCYPQVSKLMSL